MLPIKEAESIMISSYPSCNKVRFNEESEIIDKVLVDILNIRNLKASNNIGKNAYIKLEVKDELSSIYKSQLKIKDEFIITENKNTLKQNYKSNFVNITYFYEGEENNTKINDEIKKLKESILRREKLLSNENYVNKAPKNIVELDRKKLDDEKERLKYLETNN